MSDNQQEQQKAGGEEAAQDEFYVEPPRLGTRDAIGVVIALVALAVIGVLGYVWLNPRLGFSNLLHRQPSLSSTGAATTTTSASQTSASSASDGAATSSSQGAAAPQAATSAPREFDCDYCGMPATSSQSYVIATWQGERTSHHDSWDCVFRFGSQGKLSLASAQVREYGVEPASMLDAAQAFYLYDTKEKVKGSMPPYVAAYASRSGAKAARTEMGGEVLAFTALEKKWEER
jgi:hypothetical protein